MWTWRPGEMRIRQQLQSVGKRLVLQELKTEKSRRTLALPAGLPRRLRRRIARGSSKND